MVIVTLESAKSAIVIGIEMLKRKKTFFCNQPSLLFNHTTVRMDRLLTWVSVFTLP